MTIFAVLTDDELAFEAAHSWSARRSAAIAAEIAFRLADCVSRAAA
jgi:hypothetical protein